jgi:hypothetical protein
MSRGEMFPPMWKVVPEGTVGTARVEHFAVDTFASRMTMLQGGRDFVAEGKYAKLAVGGQLVMSDTPYERRTNYDVCARAHGRVLVAGYGLGMILTSLLPNEAVDEVVVVEKCPDVVALVDPHIRRHVGARASRKLIVLDGGIHEMRPALSGKFDVLWFDIWGDTSTDSLAEMTALTRKYRALCAGPESFMGCWDRDWLRYRKRQEARAGW